MKAKRKELKQTLVESIRECVDTYSNLFVFAYDNMRASKFKDVRGLWADSRFFLGKNRVIQKALGEDSEDAYRPGLDQLASDLTGQVGLLFTSRPVDEVLKFFAEYQETDFARAGFVPAATVTVPAGRLADVPHTMAETLTKLGMPVRLDKGVVVLPYEHTICKAGEAITPDQGKLLKHFGHELAVFRLRPLALWSGSKYSVLEGADAATLKALGSGSAAVAAAGAGGKAAPKAAPRKKEKKPAPKGRSGSGVGNTKRGGGRIEEVSDDEDEDDEESDEEGEGMEEDDE